MEHEHKNKCKNFSESQHKFIDAALTLFSEHGYEGTSINQVIEKSGLSKGTFYHYYKSKEHLLDDVVCRIIYHMFEETRAAYEDRSKSAVKRLNIFIDVTRKWKFQHLNILSGVTNAIYKDENIIIRYKINKKSTELILPDLADIITQGIEEGTFNTTRPEDTARIMLGLSYSMGESMFDLFFNMKGVYGDIELYHKMLNFYFSKIEAVLGIAENSIKRTDIDVIEKFFNVMKQKKEAIK